MSHWRDRAEHVIKKALAGAEAQGLDEKAALALVDRRYPFGERAYHPYQMWLKVRRELVPSLKVKQAEKARKTTVAEGQGELPL